MPLICTCCFTVGFNTTVTSIERPSLIPCPSTVNMTRKAPYQPCFQNKVNYTEPHAFLPRHLPWKPLRETGRTSQKTRLGVREAEESAQGSEPAAHHPLSQARTAHETGVHRPASSPTCCGCLPPTVSSLYTTARRQETLPVPTRPSHSSDPTRSRVGGTNGARLFSEPLHTRVSFLNAQKTQSLEKQPLLAFPAQFPWPLPPTVAVSPWAGTVSGGCGAPVRGGRITSGASSRTQCPKSALVPAVPAKPHIPAWDETVTTPPPQVTEPSSEAPGVKWGVPGVCPPRPGLLAAPATRSPLRLSGAIL